LLFWGHHFQGTRPQLFLLTFLLLRDCNWTFPCSSRCRF
jgi:hypothetical protein